MILTQFDLQNGISYTDMQDSFILNKPSQSHPPPEHCYDNYAE